MKKIEEYTDKTNSFLLKNGIKKDKLEIQTVFSHTRNSFDLVYNFIENCFLSIESKNLKNFHLVYKSCIEVSNKYKNIADLTSYDVALIITEHKPSGVYLHSGTKDGCINLLKEYGLKKPNLNILTYTHLPNICKNKSYTELEDIFCIYKSNISKMINVIQNRNVEKCKISLIESC
jgi:hypothetical protein